MIHKTVMDTDADRFVSPTVTFGNMPAAKVNGLIIPELDDDADVTIEVATRNHRFNYPAVPGGYLANNVVLEYCFDDALAASIVDKVHGVTLAPVGNPTLQTTTATAGLGNAACFDGTGDTYELVTSGIADGILPTTGDFSIEIVCNLDNVNSGDGDTLIACRTGADGIGWQLQLDANQHLDFHIEDTDQQVASVGSVDVATGAYVHLVLSADRDGNAVLYINGTADSTTDISAAEKTVLPAAGANNRLVIGGDAVTTAGDCLYGDVAFVRLYNKALPAAEALENYRILMDKGYPGWVPLLDPVDGTDLIACKSASDPGFFDLTEYMMLKPLAFRARCSVEQTTTATDLDFAWVFE